MRSEPLLPVISGRVPGLLRVLAPVRWGDDLSRAGIVVGIEPFMVFDRGCFQVVWNAKPADYSLDVVDALGQACALFWLAGAVGLVLPPIGTPRWSGLGDRWQLSTVIDGRDASVSFAPEEGRSWMHPRWRTRAVPALAGAADDLDPREALALVCAAVGGA